MNKTLKTIEKLLLEGKAKLPQIVANELPFSQASAAWHNPGVNRQYLIDYYDRVLSIVSDRCQKEITDEQEKSFATFEYSLTFLRDQTIPNLPGGSQQEVAPQI
jgi:hypothetical protein